MMSDPDRAFDSDIEIANLKAEIARLTAAPKKKKPLIAGGGAPNWGTPPPIVTNLSRIVGGFDVDAAADLTNAKAPTYFGIGGAEPDGLAADWSRYGRKAWLNCPYNKIGPWVDKAIEQAARGVCTTLLLPAFTGTWWFHDLFNAGSIVLVRGRIPFIPPPGHDPAAASPTFAPIVAFLGLNEKRGVLGIVDAKDLLSVAA